MKRDGWSVLRHVHTNILMLAQGSQERWGYVFIAWTAGSRQDGEALLAEMKQKGEGR